MEKPVTISSSASSDEQNAICERLEELHVQLSLCKTEGQKASLLKQINTLQSEMLGTQKENV